MSSESVNPELLARQVAAEIAKAANAALAESVSSITAASAEELERHRVSSKQIDAYLAERAEAHDAAVAKAVRKLTGTETQLSHSVAAVIGALEARITSFQDAAETSKTLAVRAAEQTGEATAAALKAKHRVAAAIAAERAAERRIAAAEQAEARAQEAISVVQNRADLEVEAAYAQREAKLKRKTVLAELDREETELINRFSAQFEAIEKKFDVHYGHIKQELERASEEPESDKSDSEEKSDSTRKEQGDTA